LGIICGRVAAESWALDDGPAVRATTVQDVVDEPAWDPASVPKADRVRGAAHMLDTTTVALGHCSRHLEGIKDAESPDSLAYNTRHLENHLAEAVDHHSRAVSLLSEQYPEIGSELGKLHQVTQLDRATSGRGAGGDYDVVMPGSRPGPEPA